MGFDVEGSTHAVSAKAHISIVGQGLFVASGVRVRVRVRVSTESARGQRGRTSNAT